MTREEVARIKVELALDDIQEAQRLLNSAAEHLCSVYRVDPVWKKLTALHDSVRKTWYRLDGMKRKASLDHDPNPQCKCDCDQILTHKGAAK